MKIKRTIFFKLKKNPIIFFYGKFLKSALRSLKWGFLTLKWNLVLYIYPYSEMVFSALFSRYFRDLRDLVIGFPAFEKVILLKSK